MSKKVLVSCLLVLGLVSVIGLNGCKPSEEPAPANTTEEAAPVNEATAPVEEAAPANEAAAPVEEAAPVNEAAPANEAAPTEHHE